MYGMYFGSQETYGLARLKELGRVDLSIEKSIVLNPKLTHLFSERDRKRAKEKLFDQLSK